MGNVAREGAASPDLSESAGAPAALLAAVFTYAVDLEVVAGRVKVIFTADVLFNLGYFGRKELDGSAAVGADHVMVVTPVELVLIARHAVRKRNSAGQPALRKQLQRAIDGGKADLRILFSHQAKKLVGGKMVTGLQEGAQDGVALVGVLQADALQMPIKDFLRLAHGLA